MSREFLALAQDKLRDLQMEARAEGVRLGELRKINKDFANAYRFRRMTVYYKEPLKLRLESEVQSQRIIYILNAGSEAGDCTAPARARGCAQLPRQTADADGLRVFHAVGCPPV
jgi:hypothetical protein